MVLCSLIMGSKKENVKKKVWFADDVKQPFMAGMMCTINGNMFSPSLKIPVWGTQVHHVISPKMIQVCMMSSTSMSQSKIAPILCLL